MYKNNLSCIFIYEFLTILKIFYICNISYYESSRRVRIETNRQMNPPEISFFRPLLAQRESVDKSGKQDYEIPPPPLEASVHS